MKTILRVSRACLTLGLLVVVAACNRTQFSPMPEEISNSVTPQSEEIMQGSQPAPVDLLVVMDNSRSMADEQEKMAERTQNLLNEIDSLDWRIGITTTDVSTGSYGLRGELLALTGGQGKVLLKGANDAQRIFGDTMKRDETLTCPTTGVCPTGDEQPLAATLQALQKRNGVNQGFFRPNADMMVLIITDEDEKSNGAAGATTGAQLVNGVRQILSDDQKFIVSAIVVKPGDTSCFNQNSPDGNYANVVAGAVALTGGFLGSVCAVDYADQLRRVGQLVRKAADSFELTQTPEAGTLEISFSPAQPQTKWKLVGRKVVFTQNPPPIGTFMRATYIPMP
ncbi:MAG: hypothetical protein KF767_12200 [Bdellovibrionaceae bacterium]|nr:hypothetical protein [Pseudobdellovibrionaceae bacterium]